MPANTRTTYTEQEDVTLAVPEYGDNIFIGWYESEEYPMGGDITGWNAGDKTGSVELYAKWILLSLDVNATIDEEEIDLSNGVWDILDFSEEIEQTGSTLSGYSGLEKKVGFRTYTVSGNEVLREISGSDSTIFTANADSNKMAQQMIAAFGVDDEDFVNDSWVGWYWHKVLQNELCVTDIIYVEVSESGIEEENNDSDGENTIERMIHGNLSGYDGLRIKTNSDKTQYTITYSYNGGKTQCTYTLKKR